MTSNGHRRDIFSSSGHRRVCVCVFCFFLGVGGGPESPVRGKTQPRPPTACCEARPSQTPACAAGTATTRCCPLRGSSTRRARGWAAVGGFAGAGGGVSRTGGGGPEDSHTNPLGFPWATSGRPVQRASGANPERQAPQLNWSFPPIGGFHWPQKNP